VGLNLFVGRIGFAEERQRRALLRVTEEWCTLARLSRLARILSSIEAIIGSRDRCVLGRLVRNCRDIDATECCAGCGQEFGHFAVAVACSALDCRTTGTIHCVEIDA